MQGEDEGEVTDEEGQLDESPNLCAECGNWQYGSVVGPGGRRICLACKEATL